MSTYVTSQSETSCHHVDVEKRNNHIVCVRVCILYTQNYHRVVLGFFVGLVKRRLRRRVRAVSHFLACFLQKAMYSSTSSLEPMATGAFWWMLTGWMSRTFWKPVEAMPPACSMMKAMGFPS